MFMDCDNQSLCGKCDNENNIRSRGYHSGLSIEMKHQGDCGCDTDISDTRTWGLKGYPLASVYAPLQQFDNLYEIKVALDKGTIFSELDLPFRGESVAKGGCCCG